MKHVAHVEEHAELDSTNSRAAELAADASLPLPALVVADRQRAGRGRGANRWWSSDGALTFSLLLPATDEQLPTARWPLVSLAAALAVGDVLTGVLPGRDVRVKWPNDAYVEGRKICGILVEAPPVRPARLVLGIGLNVNNSLRQAPEELRSRATSLLDEAGQAFDRQQVLQQVVAEVLDCIPQIVSGELSLVERWRPVCLLWGRRVEIDCGGEEIAGRCESIDASGALQVRTDAGLRRLFSGVVKRWA